MSMVQALHEFRLAWAAFIDALAEALHEHAARCRRVPPPG